MPQTPADLVDHNCLIYGGLREAANWPFVGPDGPFSVSVRGNLSSNSIETIRAGVLAGVGIGFFTEASLVGELADPDIVTVLDAFVRRRQGCQPRLAETPVRPGTRPPHDRVLRRSYIEAPLHTLRGPARRTDPSVGDQERWDTSR